MNKLTNRIFMITGVILVMILIGLFGWLGWLGYGHITQKEIITIEITSKDKTSVTSAFPPTIITYYKVRSNDKIFLTSRELYNEIAIGKEYTFRVSGWPVDKRIQQILEE